MSTYSELPAYAEFNRAERTPTGHYAIYVVGPKGGGSRRTYICHECGEQVDTDSASYPVTKHAVKAAYKHVAEHGLVSAQAVA
jgi:hypothetical protein